MTQPDSDDDPPFDPETLIATEPLDLTPFEEESRALASVIAELSATMGTPDQPGALWRMRADIEVSGMFAGAADGAVDARTIDGPAGPIPVRVIVSGTADAVYLDIHGGGFAFMSASHNDGDNWRLARAANVAVVSVDYRLSPEFHFPAGLDDCQAVANWLYDNAAAEFGTERLVIGGASAGANLAVATLLRMREAGRDLNRFAGANLVVGVYDQLGTPSARASSNWPALQTLSRFYTPHLDDEGRRHPHVSPLYADLTGMPTALFTAAGLDALRDDSLFMAARWQAAGSAADLVVFPESDHIFTTLPTRMAAIANARIHAFVRGVATGD